MTPYPLHRSERNTKILITLFLLSMLAAFVVASINIYDKVARFSSGVAHRYGPEVVSPLGSDAAGNPGNENLPMENEPVELAARMNTFTALMDITHPHLFQIPMMLFVLAHFLMRARVSEWFKLANYVATFGGMIAFISSPWLVRYLSIRCAPLLYLGAGAMAITIVIMVFVPIWDMWQPPRRKDILPRAAAVSAGD
jgi:hypothetical protein